MKEICKFLDDYSISNIYELISKQLTSCSIELGKVTTHLRKSLDRLDELDSQREN